MHRSSLWKIPLATLSLAPAAVFAAGLDPDSVVQDVDRGYYQRALAPPQGLLKEHPQDAEVLFRYGEVLLDMGKADDTLSAMKQAVARDAFAAAPAKSPTDPTPWYWLGRASELGQLRYDEGVALLKNYIATQDHPDASPSLAWVHLRLEDLYLLSGKPDLARTEYAAAQAKADGGEKGALAGVAQDGKPVPIEMFPRSHVPKSSGTV